MYASTLIDVMVILLIIEFAFFKLLQWLYDGPHASAIFALFSVTLFLVVLWVLYGGSSNKESN